MRPLQEDLDCPICEVQRAWLRIPVVLMLLPLLLVVGMMSGAVDGACAGFQWLCGRHFHS